MKKIVAKLSAIGRGESVKDILLYWLPELVSATILLSLPPMIDSWIITRLGSTTLYGALGMGTNFLHTLIKFAEAIPVAAIAIIGRHNGATDYEQCGEGLGDTFWTTFILGFFQFIIIFFSASSIYRWLGVPDQMVLWGAPFLQAKSLGVLLIFIALGLLGFMRAVKNTRIPMLINLSGIILFIFFDYALVLGKFGFPMLGLMGSAAATIIQYSIMNIVALIYILTNSEYKKYFSRIFFSFFSVKRALHLLNLSWPIMIDKVSIGCSYVWLSKMLASISEYAIVTFDAVKNLERFAFLPVIASAAVITFLVSNRLGAKDPDGALASIKKVYLLTCLTLIPTMFILGYNASYFISIFDPRNTFTDFASMVLPVISVMVFFDFTQVVLAGALRGAGDVKTVMITRVVTCLFFFVPVSYGLNQITNISDIAKYILVYSSFYLTTGIMGLAFLARIKSLKWQKTPV